MRDDEDERTAALEARAALLKIFSSRIDILPEARTAAEGLHLARVRLGHMLNGNAYERTIDEMAMGIVKQVAELLAEWGKLRYEEEHLVQRNGLSELGREIVRRSPIYDLGAIWRDVLKRWERREKAGGATIAPKGITRIDEERTLSFLRDVLKAFGLDDGEISSRFARLPETHAQMQKRLLACGFYEFRLQLVVFGKIRCTPTEQCDFHRDGVDRSKKCGGVQVEDRKLLEVYKRFYEVHRAAGFATEDRLTDKAFFQVIGAMSEMAPDAESPTGESPQRFPHPKIAPKGERHAYARRGIGLRSDAEIKDAVMYPKQVAPERIAADRASLPAFVDAMAQSRKREN